MFPFSLSIKKEKPLFGICFDHLCKSKKIEKLPERGIRTRILGIIGQRVGH